MTTQNFDHYQLLVAPTKKLNLDGIGTCFDAAGIDKMIRSFAAFFSSKSMFCVFEHALISPKLGFDTDQQMWLRDETHELYKLRPAQFDIGWGV